MQTVHSFTWVCTEFINNLERTDILTNHKQDPVVGLPAAQPLSQ